MSTSTAREIVRRKRKEYLKSAKAEKKRILDEVQELTGYHRKSLVRLFLEEARTGKPPIRRARVSKYEPILPHLKLLWATSFYACGKRLAPFLPELLTVMKRCREIQTTPSEKKLLVSISAATIDRMLEPDRAAMSVKGRSLTKPGTLLKSKIAVRTFAQWDEKEPGFFELDLVGHCGGSGSGEFLYTLNMTDVFSGWTALSGTKGRGERGTLSAIKSASSQLPFAVKGIDSDNGSEFINYHLLKYSQDEKITFTRGREYKKNDQCHVEQKNWSVVRQFIGYRRFETDEQLAILKQVYPLMMAYHNYFSPMMRLAEKERYGSKVTKRYEKAMTPYQKLITSNGRISKQAKESLRQEYKSANPAELLRRIWALLRRLEDMSA
ncbi:MAG: transposase family protein [Armatimonadota bacterium]|nr:transposase family protein [Armatimonadota bacterium]